jgi:ABC-type sugar transport system permease subunit
MTLSLEKSLPALPAARRAGSGRSKPRPFTAATRRSQARLGIALAAPLVTVMLVFFLFPLLNAVYYVFVDFRGINANPPFVGFGNFIELAMDPNVWAAFGHNLVWIVLGTAAPLTLGLLLAVLVWSTGRWTGFYRVAFFIPFVLPHVAVGVVWSWIYDPLNGWLNQVLTLVGLGSITTGWLGDPNTALYAVLGTAIWSTTGFVFMILLAALQNVDVELVDASRVDGAGAGARLIHIILPQIMPVFLMVTTLTLVGGFSVFDIVFIMTGGGPDGATEVLGTYAYSRAFQLNRISYGTTLALIITAISVPIAMFLNRLQGKLSIQNGAV